MNAASIILLAVIAALAALACVSIASNRKKGCSCCGHSCAHCGERKSCGDNNEHGDK